MFLHSQSQGVVRNLKPRGELYISRSTSFFLLRFLTKTHLCPTDFTLGDDSITNPNTFLLVSESNSVSIASFYSGQFLLR